VLVVVFAVGFVFIQGWERQAEEPLTEILIVADYSIEVAGVYTSMTFLTDAIAS
jgi:hypothetical protein